MGIDPSSINVTDLRITRPDRSGPGGDQVGDPEELGSGLPACREEEDRLFRNAIGLEIVSFGRFFIDPIRDEDGAAVEIVPGDFAEWTNAFGSGVGPFEIMQVEPILDCRGFLDIVTFRVGRTTSARI